MLGNFTYSNPTKLYFGEDSLNYLDDELPHYGKNVLLVYGGGSVCDYAKAVSVSTYCNENPWDKYYLRMEDVDNTVLSNGCRLF